MSDLYELTVEWPSPTAQSVIVTGDFDQWSKSLPLTRSSPSGKFTGSFKVPYGSPTRYKFIVNGEWTYRQDLPTERTKEGYVNNVYYVPLEGASNNSQDGTAGRFISDLADTIAARDGTSSTLGYFASGLGKTIHTVVGVDPVNSSQIAIPTPITAHPSSGLPSPAPNSANTALTTPATTNGDARINPESEPTSIPSKSDPAVSPSQQSGPTVAPIIPIPIVPVYAKENCTIDPTKVPVEEKPTPAVFVGLPRSTGEGESKGNDETERKEFPLPVVPLITTSAPEESVVTGESQQVTKAEVVEEEVKPSPTTEEKKPAAAVEEAPKAPEGTHKVEPTAIPLPEIPSESSNGTTTSEVKEHTKSMSETSTTVKSSSRPTTPTRHSYTSVPSTPASTVNRKSKVFPQLGKASPSKGSVDELGVSKGNGTTSSKKKRHSSLLGKLKHMFHHHDKDDKKEGVH